MIKNVILSVIFFVTVLSIPYLVEAGVIIEPVYKKNQVDWIDPNKEPYEFSTHYTSEKGLKCENQIYQIYQYGSFVPARRCQLPDGAWFNEIL